MKICIIVDDYLPNSIKVAGKMMHELSVELVKQGNYVTVITPYPGIENKFEKLVIDGVNILRFKSGEIKNVSKTKRAINELLLSFRAWANLRNEFIKNKHDIIIYYSPSIFWGRLVSKLKKIWKVKSYLILRDFFPQWAIDNGILKEHSPITIFFRYFEKLSYKVADRIGIMSPKNLEWFNHNFKNKYKTEVLYNWASVIPFKGEKNIYRKKLALENKIIFFYGGNIGKAQDMSQLLRLAERYKENDQVHFLFVGSGDEVPLIKKFINDGITKNITLLDSVNQDEFKQMLTEIDVGLFCLHKNHKTHNTPGKILGYMVESKPILGTVNPENDLFDLININNAGYICYSGEDEVLYEKSLNLLNSMNRIEIGKRANELLLGKFSLDVAIKRILNV